jgi:hypothetical protein
VVVVAGRPLTELVKLIGQNGLFVDHRLYSFQLWIIAGSMAVDKADEGAAPKGNFDSAPSGRYHCAV